MIKDKIAAEIIDHGSNGYVVLADRDTYSSLLGSVYIDHFGTVWDLKKLVDRLFDIHQILDPENGETQEIDTSEKTMNALQLGYLDTEKKIFVRDDS